MEKLPKNFGKMKSELEVMLSYVIKSGKYKGYEVLWTDGGQIFPRAGYYLEKATKTGTVKDILYLEKALPKK